MSVTCEHVCSQLNTKAMNFVFDDTNGIGTAKYLVEQVLSGTGWQLGECETFLESDGKTEKVRSISSDGKRGAYLLISDICKMFGGRPVYDGDTRTVHIYSLNRHDDYMELNFGKNLNSVDRTEDASNIVTRLYVEGEYMDSGYVGIDDVNPTGLPFLLNFDYYRELGVFTEEHERALQEYLRDIAACKGRTSETAGQLITMDGELNNLWGQIDYILYVLDEGNIARSILGGEATEEQASISPEDTLTVLLANGTHFTQQGGGFPAEADFAIKWIQRASASIGGKEVAIEAKRETITRLQKQLEKETDPLKRQSLVEQSTALETEIGEIFNGTQESVGLYAQMRQAVELAVERADMQGTYDDGMKEQSEIERRFAAAMGDMLRDGYWSNTSYAPGQEE